MIAPWRCSARPNSGAYFHYPSHCLPTIVRRFLERRAVAIALRHLRRLRPRSGADLVEQLTDKTERVNLIVVPAGRETQELGPQVRKPWCALPDIEAEHRHAAAHGLRAHGLVAAAWELLAVCVGVPLDCAPLEERAHARNDVPVLLGPERRPCVCRKLRPLDLVRESLNVGHDGRTDLPVLEPGFFTLQV